MAVVIAIANDKGGVGKTTTTANLGAALAARDRRVLLVDADPQANLSELFGVDDEREPGPRLEDALTTELPTAPEPWSARRIPDTDELVELAGGVHILPCTERLADSVDALTHVPEGEYRLRALLDEYAQRYDYILIDTPPGAGALRTSTLALLAADWVIVPARPADFDVAGAIKLADRIVAEFAEFNPRLALLGVLISQLDRRWKLGVDTRRQLKADGIQRLRIEIPFMVRVGSAPRFCAPTVVLEPHSRVAQAFRNLARDIDDALTAPSP